MLCLLSAELMVFCHSFKLFRVNDVDLGVSHTQFGFYIFPFFFFKETGHSPGSGLLGPCPDPCPETPGF